MQELVGYSLINTDHNEVQHWGDTLGLIGARPITLWLPNGDIVYSPALNVALSGGYQLVERWIVDDPIEGQTATSQTTSYDGTKILITNNYVPATADDIAAIKARKVALALAYMQAKLETTTVSISVQGVLHSFPCDTFSRENIVAVNTGIARRTLSVSDPRLWIVADSPAQINVSHIELGVIGEALLSKKDELLAIFVAHKINIMAMSNYLAIQAYDFTTGY